MYKDSANNIVHLHMIDTSYPTPNPTGGTSIPIDPIHVLTVSLNKFCLVLVIFIILFCFVFLSFFTNR